MTVKPRELNVDYKFKAVIKCQVHGYPFDRVYWLHDGRMLTHSDNVAIVLEKKGVSRVEIKAVDRHSEGVYQCFAESGSIIEPQDNAQGRTVLVPHSKSLCNARSPARLLDTSPPPHLQRFRRSWWRNIRRYRLTAMRFSR